MPVAAVVIPTRNRRERLERAIASVLGQKLEDWELVVVDDASTDDTPAFLTEIEDPRIRAICLDEHGERSAARNRGLELVRSRAVLFLDDDDELLPGALELLTGALERHAGVCASVGAAIYEVDGTRRRQVQPKRPLVIDVRLELLAGWVALGGQSLFRTSLLKDVGGWQDGLSVAEDQELWLRVATRGPVAIVPESVLVHRPHGLVGDASGWRELERDVVRRYLLTEAGQGLRARKAAAAREHLRDADVAFKRAAYRTALLATIRAVTTAPFLFTSPLIGRGCTRGLFNALVAAVLPHAATNRLRALLQRRRGLVA